tara:strand:+ start:94 stop:585 length:492 start_codon:yes stop_codon:yes gene_type:complete
MALTDKKYEKFYKTTGTGDDKLTSDELSLAEDLWDLDRANGMKDHINNPDFAPLIFQLQQIQDELDYLRTEISTNKDKTGISGSQATAITANEKAVNSHATSITGLTNDMKAVQQNLTVMTDSGIEAKFENLKVGLKSSTIDLKITDNNQKPAKSYKATITLQ